MYCNKSRYWKSIVVNMKYKKYFYTEHDFFARVYENSEIFRILLDIAWNLEFSTS